MDKNKAIKITLLGAEKTGKTIFYQYLQDFDSVNTQFDNYIATIAASYMEKKIIYNNKKYSVEVWDTAGERKYFFLTKFFIKDSHMIFIFYDSNNKETFERAKEYFDLAKEVLDDEDEIIILVSNKYDLPINSDEENNQDNNNVFNEEEAFEFAENNNILLSHLSTKEKFSNGVIELLNKAFREYNKKKNVEI